MDKGCPRHPKGSHREPEGSPYIYIYDIYIYIYIYDTSDISQHDILRAAASPFRVARVAGKS